MHQYKAIIHPKNGEPFSLIVGACAARWTSFAFCVHAVSLDERNAQYSCLVSKPETGAGNASAQLWLLAEGWRRSGAAVDMKSQPKDRLVGWPRARFEDWTRDEVEGGLVNLLRADWFDEAARFSTTGDRIMRAFNEVADTIRLGPPK